MQRRIERFLLVVLAVVLVGWMFRPQVEAAVFGALKILDGAGNARYANVNASNQLEVNVGNTVRVPVTPQDSGGTSMTDTTAHATKVLVVDAAGTAVSVGVLDACAGNAKVHTPISLTANTQLITGTALKKTYVCSILLISSAAGEGVSLVAGTGSVCGTSTVAVIGGATAATGLILAANVPVSPGNGAASIAATTVNADNLCLLKTSAALVSGVMTSVVQ